MNTVIKLLCLLGFLCGGNWRVEAQQQYVERAILIKVIDSEEKSICEPKVVVYDSTHTFLKEEVAVESLLGDGVKKIIIDDFGKYYLQFSKEGYEPVEEVCVIWRNDQINRSSRVIMNPTTSDKNYSLLWFIPGIFVLILYRVFFLKRKSNN